MKRTQVWVAAGTAVVIALAAGYWLGNVGARPDASAGAAQTATGGGKKLLYYRNPMGLPDTSPVPKKDPMGMDYVPVYEGEDDAQEKASADQVRVSADKIQKLGVRTEKATMRTVDRVVRASGRIEVDERRVFAVSPKFEGWIERLFVNATGQPVSRGQALFDVYSPELVSAQREYAVALEGVAALRDAEPSARESMQQLADAALARLRNWDIPADQIKALESKPGERRTLVFRSPVSGIVMEKKGVQGMRFMPGEAIYQIADLSSVWVQADVFEQDAMSLREGAPVRIRVDSQPGKTFEGRVAYIYPTVKTDTRTLQVRVELANREGRFKPGMYAQVEIPGAQHEPVLTVPNSAVIDSGKRRVVLVQAGEGRFEPRDVKTGLSGSDYVEVLSGVKEGEVVVVAANFLIDAESNLKAAIGGLGQAAPAAEQSAGAASGEHADHAAAAKPVAAKAHGRIEAIDAKAGSLTIAHEPIASLKWPAMSMDFGLTNSGQLKGLKVGDAVDFELAERAPGDWVVTAIAVAKGAPGAHDAHAGH
ncbi:efflux RND transporter periplasmic adaptor subunit [Niveibacterium sp. SC-1]|uniref:efflux RND transporter periplasmic adaptor subunit n=1 Tax=Niveibacterium sp. SC-1 TaxID=3135646 RepID=UPI00311DC51D